MLLVLLAQRGLDLLSSRCGPIKSQWRMLMPSRADLNSRGLPDTALCARSCASKVQGVRLGCMHWLVVWRHCAAASGCVFCGQVL